MNRKDEALSLLTQLAKEQPNNLSLLVNKALLLDESYKKNKSQLDSTGLAQALEELITSYESILSLSPRNPLANFNLAVVYSEKANTYVKALNGMNSSGFALYSDSYQAKSKEALEKAVSYLEAAKSSQPKNLNILNALQLFYEKLSRDAERAAIEQEIQSLKN